MAKRYGEDLSFEQDAVIIKIKKSIKKLAKSKTWKGDLGNRERPGGLKTRKGGPGKNYGHKKGMYSRWTENPKGRSRQNLGIFKKKEK